MLPRFFLSHANPSRHTPRAMSQMLKSSGAMAAATMLSRVLGMVREMAYGWFMGTGWVADAFVTAFSIPNLFRRLLGEGALTAAFIPIFKDKERTATREEMWRAANAVVSALIVASAVIVGVVIIGVTIALELHTFSSSVDLMLRLLRVMFPYMFFVCLAAVFIGILNARGHFFMPAIGATMLNVVMIASVFLLTPAWPGDKADKVFALAFGVVLAGVAQALFQLPTLHRDGFQYRWVKPWRDETVRTVVRRMLPGTIGVAAFQINVLVVQNLGLVIGSVGGPITSPFNYAVRLMELPQGVFGISLATYLLPTLAGLAAEKKFDEFRANVRHGIEHLLFVNVICALLLIVLAEPAVRLLFERGNFTPQSTHETAIALRWLSASLIGYSLVNVFARAFYAMGDTRTPMKISIVCLIVNLVCAVALVFPMRQAGFGLANTISSTLNCALLLFALRKKLKTFDLSPLRPALSPLVLAAIVAGVLAWCIGGFCEQRLGHDSLIARLASVFIPGGIAAGIYWWIGIKAKIPAAMETWQLLRHRQSQ